MNRRRIYIPHDERIYALWNKQVDFTDKVAMKKLRNELEDMYKQLNAQQPEVWGQGDNLRISRLPEIVGLENKRSRPKGEMASLEHRGPEPCGTGTTRL